MLKPFSAALESLETASAGFSLPSERQSRAPCVLCDLLQARCGTAAVCHASASLRRSRASPAGCAQRTADFFGAVSAHRSTTARCCIAAACHPAVRVGHAAATWQYESATPLPPGSTSQPRRCPLGSTSQPRRCPLGSSSAVHAADQTAGLPAGHAVASSATSKAAHVAVRAATLHADRPSVAALPCTAARQGSLGYSCSAHQACRAPQAPAALVALWATARLQDHTKFLLSALLEAFAEHAMLPTSSPPDRQQASSPRSRSAREFAVATLRPMASPPPTCVPGRLACEAGLAAFSSCGPGRLLFGCHDHASRLDAPTGPANRPAPPVVSRNGTARARIAFSTLDVAAVGLLISQQCH